jgi:O-antigen/teichoic acid export membrane protein
MLKKYRNKIKGIQQLKITNFYILGSLFNKGFSFIMLPVLTRMLSTSEYGVVSTYTTWVMLCSLIFCLCLDYPIRILGIGNDIPQNDYIKAAFLLESLSFLTGMFLVMILCKVCNFNVNTLLIILCFIQSYFDSIKSLIMNKWMMNGNYVKRTLMSVIPTVLMFIMSIIFISHLTDDKYYGRIFGGVVSSAIIGIYVLYEILNNGKFHNIKFIWKYALPISLPLIIHGISNIILNQTDRLMISYLVGVSETGIYSVSYSLSTLPIAFNDAFGAVWIPWFTSKMKQGKKDEINKAARIYILGIALLNIAVCLVGREALIIWAGKDYAEGTSIIIPLVISVFFQCTYGIYISVEYYYKNTSKMASISAIAAFVNFGLNILLIPLYGAVAAAYTTLIAQVLMMMLHYCQVRKIDCEFLPMKNICEILLVATIICLASSILQNFILIRMILLCVDIIFGVILVGRIFIRR